MNVKNRAIIRKLSFKTLWASRRRNLIAVIAIALTALLFTSLFTIALSINESQQEYTFRQVGGNCHGTFKEVTEEQAAAIASHPKVKAAGIRKTIGIATSGVFAKTPAEISFMDENCTVWSYAQPTVGNLPKGGKEITMDTAALALLGVKPELGAEIELTWTLSDQDTLLTEKTDTFLLAGWWEYDEISPVHYLNVSESYVEEIQAETGYFFRADLNVMMASSLDIRGQMEQVNTDLGYTWDSRGEENNVRIGVNWGYTTAQLSSGMDAGTALAIAAFIGLVVFTGYLIIYNIFQISVTGDIRFYGLLKTIGVTPRQLRRIIRWQALILSAAGIPLGLIMGYGVGALLVPLVMRNSNLSMATTLSTSPLIFLFSALFALGTVLLSCSRPGKIAARVSPVEAVRYTENPVGKQKGKRTSGAKVWQMAAANLSRNRRKTCLVVVSLTLAVVLLNVLTMFVGGFDMEKYLAKQSCADFIVSTTDYFRYNYASEYISQSVLSEIIGNTESTLSGSGYTLTGPRPSVWMQEGSWRKEMERFVTGDALEQTLAQKPRRGALVAGDALIEGLDPQLFDKLEVVEGTLSPLTNPGEKAIALAVDTDDYGAVEDLSHYPKIGETVTVTYITKAYPIDSRTGEDGDENTPPEFLRYHIAEGHDVSYTVCAYVVVPYSMSYRYRNTGYRFVLPVDTLANDSGQAPIPLFYLFDTSDAEAEAGAEAYLSQRTASDPQLMYESKATVRSEFRGFQSMFLLLGGLLCAIIGVVGVLNFFNAIMTGILSRQREFAVLQAVGMTGKQLKAMLVYEGIFYAMGAAVLALLLSLILNPLVAKVLETMFWFFTPSFTITPVLLVFPVFCLLGWSIPVIMYRHTVKQSVVQRLRAAEM